MRVFDAGSVRGAAVVDLAQRFFDLAQCVLVARTLGEDLQHAHALARSRATQLHGALAQRLGGDVVAAIERAYRQAREDSRAELGIALDFCWITLESLDGVRRESEDFRI